MASLGIIYEDKYLEKTITTNSRVFGSVNNTTPHIIYVPAHVRGDKHIIQKAVFKVITRTKHHVKHVDGIGNVLTCGVGDVHILVAWGNMADTCCRILSPGKRIDVVFETRTKAITEIIFGEESREQTDFEVMTGLRPAGWNSAMDIGGQNIWHQMMELRNKQIPNYDTMTFGFAKIVPYTQGLIADYEVFESLMEGGE